MQKMTFTRWCTVWLGLMLVAAMPAQAQLIPSFGSDRAGTSGFQFLKIPVDARSAALGETVASNAFDASALFWNPALAAQSRQAQVGLSHTAYFADVQMDYVAAFRRFGGFTLGASLQTLSSGEMDVTTEFQPFGTGQTFSYLDVAAGLTVAQQLTDLFSYGVTAKYIRESVAGLTTQTAVFDLGIFYRIGGSGVQMAVAIRNFGLDGTPDGELERVVIGGVVTETDFESITPPTSFLLGMTYDVFQNNPQHSLQVSGQLSNPNDNAESLNAGVEYTWNDLLILRTGYRLGVDEYTTPSFGAGLNVPPFIGNLALRFDYGFTQLERLGTVHRVGLNLGL
ncbi:MAG: type IX secretion system outer membrane channel protein PorV [Rhodothermales bacterium]